MSMRTVYKVTVFLLLVITMFAQVGTTHAYYRYDGIKHCTESNCEVVTNTNLQHLENGSKGIPITLKDKLGNWWSVTQNEFVWQEDLWVEPHQQTQSNLVPFNIVFRRDSYTNLPQMGITWVNDKLFYSEPNQINTRMGDGLGNYVENYEGILFVRSDSENVLDLEKATQNLVCRDQFDGLPLDSLFLDHEYNRSKIVTTHGWDGLNNRIITWIIIPEFCGDLVNLIVLYVQINHLTLMDPPNLDPVIYHRIQDVPYSEGYIYGGAIKRSNVVIMPEDKEMYFQPYISWVDGYSFSVVGDRFLYQLDSDDVEIRLAKCLYNRRLDPERCGNPYIDYSPYMYVYPTSSKTLVVSDVPPWGSLKPEDLSYMNEMINKGYTRVIEGKITENLFVDGTYVISVSGEPIPLSPDYKPLNGTVVDVYFYNEKADKNLQQKVLALRETDTDHYWYFSNGSNIFDQTRYWSKWDYLKYLN